MTLGVSADLFYFSGNNKNRPDDFRLEFEAVSRFDPGERKIIQSLLDGVILKHEEQRGGCRARASRGGDARAVPGGPVARFSHPFDPNVTLPRFYGGSGRTPR